MLLIAKNLTEFVNTIGLSDRAFENEVGWSNGFYGKVKSGKTTFSIEKLRSIVDRFPDLNVHWLCTGDGDMFVKKNDELSLTDKGDLLRKLDDLYNHVDYAGGKLIDDIKLQVLLLIHESEKS